MKMLNCLTIKQESPKINLCKLVFFSTLVLFIATLAAQLYLVNNLALKSKDLKHLTTRKEELEKSIAKLEYEDATLSSLSYIENQARSQGFVDMRENILTLNPVTSVAALTPAQ